MQDSSMFYHKYDGVYQRDCPDRSPTCHGTCEKYLKESAEAAEKHQAESKKKYVMKSYNDEKKKRILKKSRRKDFKSI